jgi:hypothetical protein
VKVFKLTILSTLDDNEMRTVVVHLTGTPIPRGYIADFKEKLMNFSVNGTITLETIQNCTLIHKDLEKAFSKKLRNKCVSLYTVITST